MRFDEIRDKVKAGTYGIGGHAYGLIQRDLEHAADLAEHAKADALFGTCLKHACVRSDGGFQGEQQRLVGLYEDFSLLLNRREAN